MTGPPPPSAATRVVGPAVLVVAGCVLVVGGMFLPWVTSGAVDRNSFQVAGVVDRLDLARRTALSWLPGIWPLVAVGALLPVALLVVGLRRVAGGSAVLIGMSALVLGVATLTLGAGRSGAGIRIAPTGPAVLAAGAAGLVTAGVLLLRRRRVVRAGSTGGPGG